MNCCVLYTDAHDSELGWTTRRRQNDLQWIQLVAGNIFSGTVYKIQVRRIAGATAYVMNCNLWPSDCTNINIALFWGPIEQSQPDKTTKYQTPSHYNLLKHRYEYISARPISNNAAWKCLLADSRLTADWHVPCLCCVERCCAGWSEAVKEKMNIIFWEEFVFFRCFIHTTKRRTSSKNTKLLPMIWAIVTVSVCSFHYFIIRLRSRNISLKFRVTAFIGTSI